MDGTLGLERDTGPLGLSLKRHLFLVQLDCSAALRRRRLASYPTRSWIWEPIAWRFVRKGVIRKVSAVEGVNGCKPRETVSL